MEMDREAEDTGRRMPDSEKEHTKTEESLQEKTESNPSQTSENLPDDFENSSGKDRTGSVASSSAKLVMTGGILIKRGYVLAALFCTVALTVGSLFIGMWIYQRYMQKSDGIDPAAKDYHSIYADAGSSNSDEITIPGYNEVFFPAGERDVQIVLLNPDGNPCYFRFSLILSNTGEELYQSGLIPPGMAVTDVRLNRALDVGTYDLRIHIESFSLADRSTMNGADMETHLIVSR